MLMFEVSSGADVNCVTAAAFRSTITSVACTHGKVSDRCEGTASEIDGIGTDDEEDDDIAAISVAPRWLAAAAPESLLPSQCCRPDT